MYLAQYCLCSNTKQGFSSYMWIKYKYRLASVKFRKDRRRIIFTLASLFFHKFILQTYVMNFFKFYHQYSTDSSRNLMPTHGTLQLGSTYQIASIPFTHLKLLYQTHLVNGGELPQIHLEIFFLCKCARPSPLNHALGGMKYFYI